MKESKTTLMQIQCSLPKKIIITTGVMFALTGQIAERKARAIGFNELSKELKKRDRVVTEFDERLWGGLVEYVTVGREKEITFRFREGTEIAIQG